MKIAMFGLGSIGMRHLNNLIELGEHDLMVYDSDRVRYKSVDDRPFIIVALQVQDVLDWKPEVVLICTPPDAHHGLVTKAFKRDCHVFCEKPLAVTSALAKMLVDNRPMGKMLAVGYQLRWSAGDGFDRWTWNRNIAVTHFQDMSTWPSQYEKDVLQEFSHELDIAVFLNGPAKELIAFQRGCTWQVELTHLHAHSSINISARLGIPHHRVIRSYSAGDNLHSIGSWTFDQQHNDQAYKDELAAFLEACRGEGWDDRLCSCAEAAHVVRIIEACRESARNCSVVRL